MKKEQVIIAFGANLGEPEVMAKNAALEIEKRIGPIKKSSSLIKTEPLLLPGQTPGSQPEFTNGVWIAETTMAPEPCLSALLEIESNFGRMRLTRWGARTIDLDLIAYGNIIYQSLTLTLPHPQMHKRSFVLAPLCEIEPNWLHPALHRSAKELLQAL